MNPDRRLRVLAPTRYPWRFNGPRRSRNIIENRNFLPFNWLHEGLEGTTAFNPWPPRRFDLTHAFNRIPLHDGPFVIGFESHLPRGFGLERSRYYRAMARMLAAPRCRRIVAISEHARRTFAHAHRDTPLRAELLGKLSVRYPNLEVPDGPDRLLGQPATPFTIAFVGNHFARKGGCVAVRLAELAEREGVPLVVEIVSSLQVGGSIWTDPVEDRFFDPYRALLRGPNVRWHEGLSNAGVHDLLRRSHLSLLTTFSDTFGYSAIESMVNWTPVIATRQGALPEFIAHGRNGLLLDFDLSPHGEWLHLGRHDRSSPAYARLVADEIERLARQTLDAIKPLVEAPERLAQMRRHARADATRMFGARDADLFWDDVYRQAIAA